MINYARQNPEEQPDGTSPPAEDHIAPAPRVSVQAFCETVETAAAVQSAGEDRRLGKAHLKIQMGGMTAAIEAYRTAPTPNVIILETEGRTDILTGLDQLATVCDAGTRVIVIGRVNDVMLYRELVRRGVSDYVLAPVNTLDVVRSICGLFSAPEAKAVGRSRAISRWIPSSPISTSRSAPPASTTIRIPCKASQMRSSRPIVSIPRSSTACCRNAPTISACLPLRRRLTGSMTSAPKRSIRFSTRCAPPCPVSCSTFRTSGRGGPSALW
jgi:pilus assembly protein CpaE